MYKEIINAFEHPDVKSFFLKIIDSDLSGENKYQQIIDFIKLYERRVSGANVENDGVFNVNMLLSHVEISIKKGLKRLVITHRGDGGWGNETKTSDQWLTTYAVLCLKKSIELEIELGNIGSKKQETKLAEGVKPGRQFEMMIKDGIEWLRKNFHKYSIVEMEKEQVSLYDISLVIKCLFRLSEPPSPEVEACLERIIKLQNGDGSWDEAAWVRGCDWPTKVRKEVGGTSLVIQALAETRREDYCHSIYNGIKWLFDVQNEDGGWSRKRWDPVEKSIVNQGSRITKTCDALQAIAAAKMVKSGELQKKICDAENKINRAVDWLQRQERLLAYGNGNKTQIGWGWQGEEEKPDINNTCLSLEALVALGDEALLPLLAANATWLIAQQDNDENSCDYGKWESELTPRITLALINYYGKLLDVKKKGL